MIWIQSGLSFCLWLVAGYWVFRRFRDEGSRKSDRLLAPLVMLAGGVVMIVSMWLIGTTGGLRDGVMTLYGWAGATVCGAVFVSAQTYGAVLAARAFRISETPTVRDTSESSGQP